MVNDPKKERAFADQVAKNRAGAKRIAQEYQADNTYEESMAEYKGMLIPPDPPDPPDPPPPPPQTRRRSSRRSGRRQAMTPLPPEPQFLDLSRLNIRSGPTTYGLEENIRNRLMQRQKERKTKQSTDPRYQYRRRLWDLQMQKAGLTPEGNQLGGLRSIMIQRMNQLRGGG